MTKEELQYYSRQLVLPEIGIAGQQKLKESAVLVIGAGGLGCPVLQNLAAAGVGHLGIVDFDKVSVSNLHRQTIYSYADAGKWKCDAAKSFVKALNPFIAVDSFRFIADESNICEAVEMFDVVVDCTDNPLSKYLINDACVFKGKPLVYGSVFKFEGNVSVFNLGEQAPTLRCLFPEVADEMPDCEMTGVLGITTALTGLYMANEVLKIALGNTNILSGRLLVLNAFANEHRLLGFAPTSEGRNKSMQRFGTSKVKKSLSPEELQVLLREKREGMLLVDVRSEEEHEADNIGGLLLPLHELEDHLYQLDQARSIVIYCQHGVRSQNAAEFLSGLGYKNVLHLEGGLHNWRLHLGK